MSPLAQAALAGRATYSQDLPLVMNRRGHDEATWFTFSYSPVRDETGRVRGLFCACAETTRGVLAQKRQEFRLELESRLREVADPDQIMALAAEALGRALGVARVGYGEIDAEQVHVNVARDWADGRLGSVAGRHRMDDFGPPIIAELKAGRTMFVDDVEADDRVGASRAAFAAIGTRSVLAVPLIKAGRFTAMLFLHHPRPRRWTADEAELALEVAERTWAAAERARANAALAASEARLRLGMSAARMVVWAYDLTTGEITRSEGADELFGPGADVETFASRIVEEDRAADRARLESALSADDGRFESEFRYRHPDGRLLWLFNQGHVVRDPSTGAQRLHGVCLDVTARKEAELALRELNDTLERRVDEALAERKLMADVVEGTDAFVQVVDLNFRWLAINPAAADEFERIFGVRPRAGESMLELLADQPEHQKDVRDIWARALAGEAFSAQGEFGDPARDRRCYEMNYRPLRDRDGRLIGAYQFVYDVTERVREQKRLAEAEAARREADALHRAYFESSPEALFIIAVEPDGGFLVERLNPAHEAGVGFRLEEVQGRRIDEFLPPELAEPVLARYREVVETGGIVQYREAFDLNGERQHWDTSLVPMRDPGGRIIRLIGSSRNVTAQVLAEEALRQSQKMEAMGQLTGGVAHDFNNLLTPIVGALDMLQRRGLGGEREQRLISGAAQSAERAKTLVQRLLAFARRQPLQPIAVDVSELILGMADLITSTTGPQIRVVVEAPRDLPPAKADPNQLEMAVLNLAVNARDAMPDGGVLRISAEAVTVGRQHRTALKPGRYLMVSVADTGIGMDPATLARAVEPFFSTKGVGKGTGLGLSMVHGLASQLGGVVQIHSTPGVGTNVELWLPQGEGRPSADAEPDGKSLSTPSGQGTVLLVDDEDLVRLSTADMLIELGFAVVEASSAEEALRLLGRGLAPDILVTDHLMPGLTGTELARAAQSSRPDLKVLIVSGYAEATGIPPDLARLSKPFRGADLAAALAGA